MTLNGCLRPDVQDVLSRLKDFQRVTVDHVFRRLYTDPDPASRFLIADEVGLGKTLVARGLIARAVDHLWDDVPRIDVVYICSNQQIARQNIDRLNITAERKFEFASRATLLPITLRELRGNKLNFVSLTPGTSFNLRSQAGWREERLVLYALLSEHWDVPQGTLSNVLRGGVGRSRWKSDLGWFRRTRWTQLDQELKEAFFRELDANPGVRQEYEAAAGEIGPRREHISPEMRSAQNVFIGTLRRLLARSSLSALQPDLVILDEFQRFKYLLEDEGEVALLSRELFGFPNVKVLLLSATPYKMYTVQGEAEDHYADFYRTVEFLLAQQPQSLAQLKQAIERYRHGLFHLEGQEHKELATAKSNIEAILRRVMVRTERLAVSADRNGMLAETLFAQDQVRPGDLAGFVHLDRIARQIDAGDQVEYWKSSAYALNLMDSYELKRRFAAALVGPQRQDVASLLRAARGHLLDWETIQAYEAIDPGNARLRAFWQQSVDTGNWQLLWLPASLPYYQPAGPFAGIKAEGYTKSLVFSAWKVVPKTIAMLLSYEAERRMLGGKDGDFAYSELMDKRAPLLTFTLSRGRLTGMPVFCLSYPCLSLASAVDPLRIARNLADTEGPSFQAVFEEASNQVGALLKQATTGLRIPRTGRADERWYWAALALLDRRLQQTTVSAWLSSENRALTWQTMLDQQSKQEPSETEGESRRYAEHVQEFTEFFRQPQRLGAQPKDLVKLLTYMALASPAVASLRAALRVTQPRGANDWPVFLAAAAHIGLAFRSLLNQPDAISLLQAHYPDGPYWEKALRYCADGNLQAVMDEYLHVLWESLGLVGHDPAESVTKVSESVRTALTLGAPSPRFDEIVFDGRDNVRVEKHALRCRYALRFGDESAEYEGRTRDADVRVAFNSPFRPFVLATTSLGQEGLDFHQYCHRVVHWNLPSNPVDLEQREGRIHRYKGHVIRRNLAAEYRLSISREGGESLDPWKQLFDRATLARPQGANDLVPYWIYETPTGTPDKATFKIERLVPVLPLSREIGHLEALKRSLVAYRSVIGQPRQQELLEFLSKHLDEGEIQSFVDRAAIDLSPCNEP